MQGPMRAHPVIVLAPQIEFLPHISQREEDFGVQALIAPPPVEGLDIAIVEPGVPSG
jgi:hypothetical protein